MKYAMIIHATGAILVILAAMMKIVHYEIVNANSLILLGFAMGYIAQTWKIKLLEKSKGD